LVAVFFVFAALLSLTTSWPAASSARSSRSGRTISICRFLEAWGIVLEVMLLLLLLLLLLLKQRLVATPAFRLAAYTSAAVEVVPKRGTTPSD